MLVLLIALVALSQPCALISNCTAADEAPLDINRARQLQQRMQAGETLTPEEQSYIQRAKQEMQKRAGQKNAPAPAGGKAPGNAAARVDTSGLVAITDLTGKYKGEDGGLYGGGRNDPPDAHRAAYIKESEKVQPLDDDGKPADSGKIGLITIGFSNTFLDSTEFKNEADADPLKSPRVIVVNGAIGSRSAVMWAWDGAEVLPPAEQERLDKEMDLVHMPKAGRKGSKAGGGKDTWPTLDARVKDAGLTAKQVQVVWMKHVEAVPRPLGDFPDHAKALQLDMSAIMTIAKQRFPNLRVAYISSRTYGGWAGPNSGSPEPFAYESGYGVRWMIQSQIKGDALNFDAARGEVKSPLLVWGPYIWANGDKPRVFDGMVWTENDVRADDHMHPSEQGTKKVAAMLLQMFHTDGAARRWYLSASAQKTGETVMPGTAIKTVAIAASAGEKKADAPAPPVKVAAASDAKPGGPLDPERVRRLMQQSSAGEKLSPEDQAYLTYARGEIQRRNTQKQGAKNAEPAAREPGVNDPKMIATLVPVTEMAGKYKGEDGGLYGGGHNEPPVAHLAAARKASAQIRPLDAGGKPSEDGKIVLLSVGLSNTTMEFSDFKKSADADPQKSSHVVVVDGAQGGRPAASWAYSGMAVLPPEEGERLRKAIETIADRMPKSAWKSEWEVAEDRMKSQGVTPQQVQVIWLKEGVPMPGRFGEFPGHARAMQADMTDMVIIAKKRYPNLRLVYFSSRTFGGYAYDTRNPEPYAYENAFSVRWVIQSQINGDSRLSYDAAPILLWGPYLWTNGTNPRKSDGLIWERGDASERDGMHPSPSGKQKVVALLTKFFKTDELAQKWYLKSN